MFKKMFFLLTFLIWFRVDAVERIENFNVDRKRVNKIYLSSGKASVVRFPHTIEEVRVGIPNYYPADTSKVYSKELTLRIKEGVKTSSNLIVRTSNEDMYVFDLVPSKINHQDVLFIDDSFYRTKFKTARSFNKKRLNKRITLIKGDKRRIF